MNPQFLLTLNLRESINNWNRGFICLILKKNKMISDLHNSCSLYIFHCTVPDWYVKILQKYSYLKYNVVSIANKKKKKEIRIERRWIRIIIIQLSWANLTFKISRRRRRKKVIKNTLFIELIRLNKPYNNNSCVKP